MPLLVEGPGMIAARECAPIARALSTVHCPPMGAGIVQGVQFVLAVAREQQGPTANAAGNEAAGLGNLRHMSEIKPALLEDSIPLEAQNVIFDEDVPIDLEPRFLPVVDNQSS